VCKDICIPVQLTLDQILPSTGMADVVTINTALQSLTTVLELPGQDVWISEPEFERDEDHISSTVRMVNFSEDKDIDLEDLRMTVLTTTSAVELTGCG